MDYLNDIIIFLRRLHIIYQARRWGQLARVSLDRGLYGTANNALDEYHRLIDLLDGKDHSSNGDNAENNNKPEE